MARTSKGFVYRPTKTAGKRTRFYWASYRDADGEARRHVLKLPNGDRVTEKSVAEKLLRDILQRVEHQAAGLIDKTVENAAIPMRVVLARYLRHLRRKGCTRSHIDQVRVYLRSIIDRTGMVRLADFNEDRIDRALGMIANEGVSPRTVNVYRRCAHSLAQWALTVARILDRNPVSVIAKRNEAVDRRKSRRSLTIGQARELLDAAGPRRLFYAVQLWTGLRVSEVLSLQWGDIELDGERPCVRLRAGTTKARRADELPLHPDLSTALAAAKPTFVQGSDPIFKTAPTLRTFKSDLIRARIATKDKKGEIITADGQGRTIDRHALRTTFITWLGEYGVDYRSQIRLARHSPQGITLRNYQDFSVFDLWAEIRKLPGFPTETGQKAQATNGKMVVPPVAPTGGLERASGSSSGIRRKSGGNIRIDVSGCGDVSKQRLAPTGTFGATGFEPATSCSQSRRATGLRHAP
jgi:integrase